MDSTWNDVAVMAKIRVKMRARMELACEFVAGAAALNCPVKTGRLRQSIESKVISEEIGRVGTNVEYAPHIEFGTQAHFITPRNQKALSFLVNGIRIVRKWVAHPGTKAKPFLRPAIMENKETILRILDFTR